ncbi:polysaccharide export protein [Parapedobacter sp. ISTM3]|uniref:polysaccharide biosynthesis/export family protein n=1 Tax=Parapedobacter sp. ISTM3 TaxID=2800130 RepID=UPI0019042C79|nr:polysaccharide biosynthesis/export family protein [Parapedobacter sp. ISTM3]MBK1442228.1 polysaccharide export protein [Parapedobacter sp. ISTM3]
MFRFCLNLSIAFLCLLGATSCSFYKKTIYFQDISRRQQTEEAIKNFTPVTVQPNDILSISVTSLNPIAWPDTANTDKGYLVDQNGTISLPMVGTLAVAGKTTAAIAEEVKEKLLPYLKEPSVVVRMLNFKITVMGDVLKPDVYPVLSERITINEALGMAGDLNITAKRSNILLIREVDGRRIFVPIDLLAGRKTFNSEYYYLKNNDIIYVEAGRNKYASVDGNYRILSLLLSAASIVAIIVTR